MFYDVYKSPFCDIILIGDKDGLAYLHLDTKKGSDKDFAAQKDCKKNSEFFKDTKKQLDEYFAGKRKKFNIKLNPQGTEFQRKVWKALQTIPHGEICSYKDIAIKVGNAKAPRAVGGANNKNPIPIIIPCHRVCGANKKLIGFGAGLEVKAQLLDMEKKNEK